MGSLLGGIAQQYQYESADFSTLEQWANNGDAKAQFKLAACYQEGIADISKDMQKALEWYIKAADQGDFSAAMLLNSLNIQMKQEEKI